jgi:hypothetical protein
MSGSKNSRVLIQILIQARAQEGNMSIITATMRTEAVRHDCESAGMNIETAEKKSELQA